MDKILLSDLKKKILIRSALISLGSLDEILGMNDVLSSDEVLLELVKKALRILNKYNKNGQQQKAPPMVELKNSIGGFVMVLKKE